MKLLRFEHKGVGAFHAGRMLPYWGLATPTPYGDADFKACVNENALTPLLCDKDLAFAYPLARVMELLKNHPLTERELRLTGANEVTVFLVEVEPEDVVLHSKFQAVYRRSKAQVVASRPFTHFCER